MAKARILVVEDSETQASRTKEFLEATGYEVLCARDGISAIKAAKTASFDVILLDLLLPDLNGNEVCRWLKLNNETRGIPIIMLTVRGSIEDKVAGLEAGADDYLPKPYNEVELNARIYAALRTKALQDELRQRNKQTEELLTKVEFLAITDPLTMLFNRRRIEDILENELKEGKRYKQPITCLMIDVDNFKQVNDLYGHKAGDSVLREIAQLIKLSLREVDIVARWGGDEFIAILPQTDIKRAIEPASRILGAISIRKFEQIPAERVTVSIGIASADEFTDTDEKLISAADFALFEAKRKGRNRIEVAREAERGVESP
ncbi:MAG TPA: diguanylate cyclase [Thermodesulfovibrionales bacterium]|nr:diguanylate cyclase [Thermodesulfovibrionales bacterium]